MALKTRGVKLSTTSRENPHCFCFCPGGGIAMVSTASANRPLRILQVSAHYVPAYHYGGVLHVAHSLSKALVAQGHEVRVCTSSMKDPHSDLDVPLDTACEVDGVQVYYEPVCGSRYWGFSPRMTRRLWSESEWADVILLHFHYQYSSLVGGWIARLRRKPYIVFTHGSMNRYGVTARGMMRKRLYLNLLEGSNFRRTLFTAYHSQEEMSTSFQFGRCQVVPNGIQPALFNDPPEHGYFRRRYPELKDRIFYLYLGRLDAGKGLDLLLPAFRQLLDKHANTHLVLAGGNERGYEATVRQMITALNLSAHVTLTGLISGADKLSALHDADAFVLPSRSEGLSIAMLEAMYMGLPIITTDRVGLWRLIQDQGCGFVTPLDENCLAEALKKMAETNERIDMGARARRLVEEKFTWDTIAADLITRIQKEVAI
jgi:glycosyltransferase involved in cell wall biosynthesis